MYYYYYYYYYHFISFHSISFHSISFYGHQHWRDSWLMGLINSVDLYIYTYIYTRDCNAFTSFQLENILSCPIIKVINYQHYIGIRSQRIGTTKRNAINKFRLYWIAIAISLCLACFDRWLAFITFHQKLIHFFIDCIICTPLSSQLHDLRTINNRNRGFSSFLTFWIF